METAQRELQDIERGHVGVVQSHPMRPIKQSKEELDADMLIEKGCSQLVNKFETYEEYAKHVQEIAEESWNEYAVISE